MLGKNNAKGMHDYIFNSELNTWESTVILPKNYEPHVFYEEVLHALDSFKGRERDLLLNGRIIDGYEYRAKKIIMDACKNERHGLTYDHFVQLEKHIEKVVNNQYPGPYFGT